MIALMLPAGKPPYTPNRPESVPSSLRRLHRQFGDFVRGRRTQGVPQYKIERKFVQLLELFKDAEIVIKMINKEQPVKYLTEDPTEYFRPFLIDCHLVLTNK